jgi:nucleotide-binding universal stress UspA family protein
VKVTRRVVVADDAASTILAAAESMEADLVAIATRGRGAIARAKNGSVADRILRESPVSTMVIHPVLQIQDFQPAFMQAHSAIA